MNTRSLWLAGLAALAALLLACGGGPASPQEGGSCDTPGQFHYHSDKHGSVSLSCGNDHVWHSPAPLRTPKVK